MDVQNGLVKVKVRARAIDKLQISNILAWTASRGDTAKYEGLDLKIRRVDFGKSDSLQSRPSGEFSCREKYARTLAQNIVGSAVTWLSGPISFTHTSPGDYRSWSIGAGPVRGNPGVVVGRDASSR